MTSHCHNKIFNWYSYLFAVINTCKCDNMRNWRHKLVDLLGQQGPKAFRVREIRQKGGREMFKGERGLIKGCVSTVYVRCVCVLQCNLFGSKITIYILMVLGVVQLLVENGIFSNML